MWIMYVCTVYNHTGNWLNKGPALSFYYRHIVTERLGQVDFLSKE